MYTFWNKNTSKFILFIYFIKLLAQGAIALEVKWIKFTPNYDRAIPPSNANGDPVEVYFTVFVQTVAPIMTAEMEFRINLRMTMTWRDERITGDWDEIDAEDPWGCPNIVIIPPEIAKRIWLPDPFIVNAKYSGIKKFDQQLAQMYIQENQMLSYTMIINATLACDMDFQFYPMDIQNCPMLIQSFAYDNSLVDFKWSPNVGFSVPPRRLIQFVVVNANKPEDKILLQVPDQGNFSQLIANFRFERLIGSHLVQSFIPCSLVVILSWFSFWLELDVMAARGFLLMTSILTLEIHLGGLKSEFPIVDYVKGVDIWMFGCIFWIFCALCEFILVKTLFAITEDARKDNLVYSISRKRNGDFPLELDPRGKGDKGLVFRVFDAGRFNPRVSPVTPYTSYWLWHELEFTPKQQNKQGPSKDPQNKDQGYRKKRLGSVVLSGRSVATSHLPIVNKSLWGFTIPLVWNIEGSNVKGKGQGGSSETRAVLYREIDNYSKIIFPISFFIFGVVYWIGLIIHSYYFS